MPNATAIIKKRVTEEQAYLQSSAKMNGKSVVLERNGRKFEARMHGTKTRYYLDGELVTKQHQFDALCSAIAIMAQQSMRENVERNGTYDMLSSPRVEAAKPGHAPAVIAFDLKHTGRVYEPRSLAIDMPPVRQSDKAAHVALHLQLSGRIKRINRAALYVGRSATRNLCHRIAVRAAYDLLKAKKQTPNVAKRAKRLEEILRILNL